MLEQFSLKGKVALITGAGRGIGAAIAEGYHQAGAKVASFEREVAEPNKNIKFYSVDLADRNSLQTNFAQFLKDFGGIDVLVNNAAITKSAPSETYQESDWDISVAINLSAVFFLCQNTGKQMIKQDRGGSIINVISIGAAQGFPNNPAYTSTKGAVRQLTKALAYDWGKYNIRVNNLGPGYTHTPMNSKSWNDPALHKQRADHTFLGRWAEPGEMTGAAIFLASDASRYMTGQDLFIDGGWLSKGI